MFAKAAAYTPLLKSARETVRIPVVGPTTKGVVAKLGNERSINFYPVKPEREGEPWVLRGRPGLEALVTLPDSPLRGSCDFNDRYFVVAGDQICEIYANGTNLEWGQIASTHGKVTMAGILNMLIIGDGLGYYSLDLDTGVVESIADAPVGRFCVFFNQRILYQGENGQVYYSELNDPTNIPGLNFFTAESLPDVIQAIATTEDLVWLIGTNSSEPFYNSDDADNPFQRVPSGVSHIGTDWPDSVLRLDNSIWMVGRDKEGAGIVWRSQGNQFTRVSTSAVERFTSKATNLTAHSYQEEGHSFYVINADQGTWAFDIKTSEWAERAWLNRDTGFQERARPETHAYAFGMHIVTDYANATVYRQALEIKSDDGQEIRRTRITPKLSFGGRQIILEELWLDFATGVGLDGAGQGTNPEVMLRVSGDGVTYGNEMTCPMGGIGAFDTCVRFHDLGIGRDWVFEISVSDPVLTGIMAGEASIKVGNR